MENTKLHFILKQLSAVLGVVAFVLEQCGCAVRVYVLLREQGVVYTVTDDTTKRN